jgi:hypothetical protein
MVALRSALIGYFGHAFQNDIVLFSRRQAAALESPPRPLPKPEFSVGWASPTRLDLQGQKRWAVPTYESCTVDREMLQAVPTSGFTGPASSLALSAIMVIDSIGCINLDDAPPMAGAFRVRRDDAARGTIFRPSLTATHGQSTSVRRE